MAEQQTLAIEPVAPPSPPPAAETPAGETPAAVAAPEAPEAQKPGDKPEAPAGEKPAKTDEDAAKSERARHRRQISAAYRREAEARARAELLEQELQKVKQSAPSEPDPAAPRIEQFKDIEEYAAAREKYAAGKALRDHQYRQQAEAHKQAQAKLAEVWEEKVERGSEKYEDFQAVVGEMKPTTPWAVAAMNADNGDEVCYYLGKNMAEAESISKLPPVMQILAIGKLSQKLAEAPAKPKTPSKAPAPITPVTGASTPAPKSIYDPNIDYDTFVKLRNKELGRKTA